MWRPLIIRVFFKGGGLGGGERRYVNGFCGFPAPRLRRAHLGGGGTCRIMGERFEVGATEFPLRIGNPDKPTKVRFGGYSRLGNPAFLYEVDEAKVSQTVTGRPGAKALTYGFRVYNASGDVFLLLKGEGLSVSSTAGTWSAKTGILRVPKKQAKEFFVSFERQ